MANGRLAHTSGSVDSFSSNYCRLGEQFPALGAIVQAKLISEARLDPIRSAGTLGRARKERLFSVVK